MKDSLLRLNIQYFAAEGEEEIEPSGDIDTFDLEAFDAKYEEELETSEEDTEEIEDNEDSLEESDDTEEEEEAPQIHDNDADKRNAAFAELRRKAEENEKYAKVIQGLADKHGMTPEEVLQQYEDSQLETQAEREGVPVDVLKRIRSLETENQSAKQEAFLSQFQAQIDETMSKYGATDEQVRATFDFAIKNGIDFENMPVTFEAAYKLAHLDEITEKRVKDAIQQDLSVKKKRQQDAGIPNGAGSSQSSQDDLLNSAVNEARDIVSDW